MVKLESLSPSKRLHAGIKNLEQAFFSMMAAILFHEVIAQHVEADVLPRTGRERADDIVGCDREAGITMLPSASIQLAGDAPRALGAAPVSPSHLLKSRLESTQRLGDN